MKNKDIKIELIEYSYNCYDGCCTDFKTLTKVNGQELELHNQDTAEILQQVLEHLGYNTTITQTFDNGY